jgi:hypothetical protein
MVARPIPPASPGQPYLIPHFGGGVDEGASLLDLPNYVASAISNVDYPKHPAASCRAGSAKLNAAAIAASPITGLYDVGLSGGTRALLAKCLTVLYKWNTATSVFDSKKTGLTAGNVRFATYKDTIIMAGPDAPLKSTDGATWAALGGTPPTAKYITVHESRVFLAGRTSYESTVYASALDNPEDWTTVMGDGASGNFPVNTNDGTVITGLWTLPGVGRLLIGKDRALYRLYGTGPYNFSAAFLSTRAGPVSQEAGVVTPDGRFYYVGHDGIYLLPTDGSPRQIQRPVQVTWETLNKAQLARIAAGYTTENGVERVLFAIPTGSATAPDKVLVLYPQFAPPGYPDGAWSIWTGIGPYLFSCAGSGTVQVGSVDYLAWGDAVGFAWKGLQGTQDGATDVAWSWTSGALGFGRPDLEHYLETVHPMARTESAGTLSVAYAMSIAGAFGTAATQSLATETPVKRIVCPFAAGETVKGYVARLRLSGTAGPATIENVTARFRRGE